MATGLQQLLDIMSQLRDPQRGCPWDRQQTLKSLIPYTLEEAYEVADAIERQDSEAVADELGDLLFQIVFYAQIGKEQGSFDFDTVVSKISDKLLRRHPHVFGGEQIETAEAQTRAWEAHKAKERQQGTGERHTGLLADINRKLPAISRAIKLQKRAAQVGFDWPDHRGVLDKIREELDEVEQEIERDQQEALAAEIGDLLFACINLARHCAVDPELALRQTNLKFETRFSRMEHMLRDRGGVTDADLASMESAWQQAKKQE